MSVKAWAKWTCPYCGYENTAVMDAHSAPSTVRELVYCDVDNGGCDALVVVQLTISVASAVRKVEAE